MIFGADHGIEEICIDNEIVVADTGFFFDGVGTRHFERRAAYDGYVARSLAYAETIKSIVARHPNVFAPQRVLEELLPGKLSLNDGHFREGMSHLQRFLQQADRGIVPEDAFPDYEVVRERLAPLQVVYSISDTDLDVLISALLISEDAQVAMVTSDRRLIFSYALLHDRFDVAVYSNLWREKNDGNFGRLPEWRLGLCREKALNYACDRSRQAQSDLVSQAVQRNLSS